MKKRRFLCIILAIVMLLPVLSVFGNVAIAQPVNDNDYPAVFDINEVAPMAELIAHFDFEGLTPGSTAAIPSVGGLDSEARPMRQVNTAHSVALSTNVPANGGEHSYSLGGSTVGLLPTGAQNARWLSVVKKDGTPLLRGSEAFVVQFDVRRESGHWPFYVDHNLAANSGGAGERYIGVHYPNNTTLNVERFSFGRPGDAHNARGTVPNNNIWYNVAIVVRPYSTALYVNGNLVQSRETLNANYVLPNIFGAEGGIVQLGKANWSAAGEFFTGLIDNVRIWNGSGHVSIPQLWFDGDVLPTEFHGIPVTWAAENGVSVVDGKIVGGDELQQVVLIATYGEFVRRFTVTIFPGGLVDIPSKPSPAVEGMEQIANFTFDESPVNGFFYGGDARARIHGNVMYGIRENEEGQRSRTALLGGANQNFWLEVEKEDGSPLLQGLTEFTISYESRPGAANTNANGWAFFGQRTNRAPKTNYENYIGVLDRNSVLEARRYAHVGGYAVGVRGSHNTPVASTTGLSTSEWRQVDIKFTLDATEIYINGELVSRVASNYCVADIMSAAGGFLFIGRGNVGNASGGSGWAHFNGQIDNFSVWVPIDERSDAEKLAEAAEALTLPYGYEEDAVRGNIHLPKTGLYDSTITWRTSHPGIVDTKEYAIENYDPRLAGWVTRPASGDVEVTMTATITLGGAIATKAFKFLVIQAPQQELITNAYVCTSFTGGEGNWNAEQVYISTSLDAFNWEDTRTVSDPVLRPETEDQGVRDPFIIRSPEGDKFYMIGTDLNIWRRNGWGNAAWRNSSPKIIIWESLDMVNWSEERFIPLAGMIHDGGHLWAPEVVYDHATGDYFVFFATSTSTVRSNLGIGPFMFYSRTRDFINFTEPKVWIEINNCIDTTAMRDVNGIWYRATKDESISQIAVDKAISTVICPDGLEHSSLTGEWTRTSRMDQIRGWNWNWGSVEGPQLFLFNERDWNEPGVPLYGLYLDRFGNGAGYWPYTTTDIGSNEAPPWWGYPRYATAGQNIASFGNRKRHGHFMPITLQERHNILTQLGRGTQGSGNSFRDFNYAAREVIVEFLDAYGRDVSIPVVLNDPGWVVAAQTQSFGFSFMGFTLPDGTVFDLNSPITRETELTAVWKPNTFVNPVAFVTQKSGNTNDLTITVTEIDSEGRETPITRTFEIRNNAADTYQVGPVRVFVDTKGNTQIRSISIVEFAPVVAVPSAFVTQQSGNTNLLTVTVKVMYAFGLEVPITETFTIRNNASGTYEVGPYSVFVETSGNTQIRTIRLV